MILFSQRLKIANKAIVWCEERDISANPFNIVTALARLGFLRKEAVEQEDEIVLWRAYTAVAKSADELAAVDESLDEFYCPVRDPESSKRVGSFYLDHGVHLMRKELERLREENDRLRRQSCNHSAHNWNRQENGTWICRGCGKVMRKAEKAELPPSDERRLA